MIKHTVVMGDTLQGIAYKYQTTVRQLQIDNPGAVDPLELNTKINIKTTEEIAKDNIASVTKSLGVIELKIADIIAGTQQRPNKLSETGDEFAGVTLTRTQEGVVKWIKDGYIYQISSDGKLIKRDPVKKGARYRYYGYLEEFDGVFVLGGTNAYAKASEVQKEEVSEAILTRAEVKAPQQSQEDQRKQLSIPQFQANEYKRTRMKVKKNDGTYLTIELRLTDFTPGYSNQLNPARTNAGWMTSIGGANLTPISMTGFWLDTKANTEITDFTKMYKEFFVPKTNVDYFSVEVVSLLHKGWEYQGLIQSFRAVDTSQTPLDRKFQMEFLSFVDKPISAKDITNKYPDVVNRDGMSETHFRSDLGKMLANPLTGYYKKDNN